MRKEGYYRVLYGLHWEIAYYDRHKNWWRIDSIVSYSDHDFDLIDTEPINTIP